MSSDYDDALLDNASDMDSEGSLVVGTEMLIKFANHSSIYLLYFLGVIVFFIYLFYCTICQQYIFGEREFEIPDDIPVFSFKVTFDGLTRFSSDVELVMRLRAKTNSESHKLPLTYLYSVECQKGNTTVVSLGRRKVDRKLAYNRPLISDPVVLFSNSVVTYDKISISIDFDHAYVHFDKFYLDCLHTSPRFNLREIYIGALCALVMLIALFYYIYSLRKVSLEYWDIRQKVSVLFLVLAVLRNNLFYTILFLKPSVIWILLDAFIRSAYRSCRTFLFFAFFTYFREKDGILNPRLYMIIVPFCFFTLILYTLEGCVKAPRIVKVVAIGHDTAGKIISCLRSAAIFSEVILLLSIHPSNVNDDARLSLFPGIVVCTIEILLEFLHWGLARFRGPIDNAPYIYVTSVSITIMLAFLFYPYKLIYESSSDIVTPDVEVNQPGLPP